MAHYVIEKLTDALNEHGKAINGAKVLVLGLAYKPDIDDPRESPSFEIISLLLQRGAEAYHHDPYIPVSPRMRSWPSLPRLESIPLTPETLGSQDAVIISTNHSQLDYDLVLAESDLVIDTRGVYPTEAEKVCKGQSLHDRVQVLIRKPHNVCRVHSDFEAIGES